MINLIRTMVLHFERRVTVAECVCPIVWLCLELVLADYGICYNVARLSEENSHPCGCVPAKLGMHAPCQPSATGMEATLCPFVHSVFDIRPLPSMLPLLSSMDGI